MEYGKVTYLCWHCPNITYFLYSSLVYWASTHFCLPQKRHSSSLEQFTLKFHHINHILCDTSLIKLNLWISWVCELFCQLAPECSWTKLLLSLKDFWLPTLGLAPSVLSFLWSMRQLSQSRLSGSQFPVLKCKTHTHMHTHTFFFFNHHSLSLSVSRGGT
jgi:hypothetical protein